MSWMFWLVSVLMSSCASKNSKTLSNRNEMEDSGYEHFPPQLFSCIMGQRYFCIWRWKSHNISEFLLTWKTEIESIVSKIVTRILFSIKPFAKGKFFWKSTLFFFYHQTSWKNDSQSMASWFERQWGVVTKRGAERIVEAFLPPYSETLATPLPLFLSDKQF